MELGPGADKVGSKPAGTNPGGIPSKPFGTVIPNIPGADKVGSKPAGTNPGGVPSKPLGTVNPTIPGLDPAKLAIKPAGTNPGGVPGKPLGAVNPTIPGLDPAKLAIKPGSKPAALFGDLAGKFGGFGSKAADAIKDGGGVEAIPGQGNPGPVNADQGGGGPRITINLGIVCPERRAG